MSDLFLKHEPLSPVRKDVYAEGIFVEHWQRLMTDGFRDEYSRDLDPFEIIFGDITSEYTQRDANIVCEFVRWLGCNWGFAYLAEVRRLNITDNLPLAYLAIWAKHNVRYAWLNWGRRTVESMLQPLEPTTRDAEILDRFAYWLGSPEGQRFLKAAEAEVEETGKQIRELEAARRRASRRALETLEARKL